MNNPLRTLALSFVVGLALAIVSYLVPSAGYACVRSYDPYTTYNLKDRGFPGAYFYDQNFCKTYASTPNTSCLSASPNCGYQTTYAQGFIPRYFIVDLLIWSAAVFIGYYAVSYARHKR